MGRKIVKFDFSGRHMSVSINIPLFERLVIVPELNSLFSEKLTL
jgi:hypothetical protein